MRALLLVAGISSCAVRPAPVPPGHAASANAPTGRLAGAPPALRPGVVEDKDGPGMGEGATANENKPHRPH